MTRTKKSPSRVRRVAEATLDVAIGGTALAADKALETFDRIADRAEGAFRRSRREARQQAERARDRALDAVDRAERAVEHRDTRPYEERTREELYDLAAERDIEGRSSMTKDELIVALRAAQ